MEGINYKSIDFSKLKNNQIGLGKDVKAEEGKYKDGLTEKEMKKMDKDGDGVLTEKEFKAACKGDDKTKEKYWNAYTEFCGVKSKTDKKTGKTTLTQNVAGQTTTTNLSKDGKVQDYTITTKNKKTNKTVSKKYTVTGNTAVLESKTTKTEDGRTTNRYDKDGNLTSKTQVDKDGTKVIKYYEQENGKNVVTKQTTKNPDGSRTTVNKKTGVTRNTEADGSYVRTDKNGNILTTHTKSADGKETKNSFKYDKNGNLTEVSINGQKYVNGENCTITTKNGKTVVKDKDGKNILATKKDSADNTIIYNYENGKRSKGMKVSPSGMPISTSEYKDGVRTSKEFCNTGRLREYKYDSNGKLVSSTDTSKDGKKLSEQTYNADEKWATREYYDEKGNVKNSKTYEYQTDKKTGVTTKTAKTYNGDLIEGSLQKTTVTKTDANDKLIEEITYDKNGEITKKKEPYKGDDKNFTGYTTTTYKNGKLTAAILSDEAGNIVQKDEYNEKGQWTKATVYEGNKTTTFEAEFPDETEAATKMTTIEDGKETVSRTLYGWLKEIYPDKTQSEIKEIEKLVKSMNSNTEFDATYMNKGAFAELNLPDSLEKALQEEKK